MAKCKQACLCSFGLTKCWLCLQFLAMAKCKQACLCSFGLTKLFNNLSQICTMRQKRNFTTKNSSFFVVKSTMLAAIGHVKHRRMWCHVGCAWQVLSITANRIDNTCSNRSQDAWRSHALWVAVGKCCQLRQAKSTMLAAIGRRMRGVVTPCGLQLASVVNYGKQNRQYLQQQVT